MTGRDLVVLGAAVFRRPAFDRAPAWLGVALAVLSLFVAPAARADVSSWASVGAGPAWLDDGVAARSAAALEMEVGIGTPPSGLLAVGGLFHVQTYFGQGTDIGLLGRVATRGFVFGDWGAALDLGGYERFWGRGSEGALGKIVLGAPWGLQLGVGGGIGTKDARFFGVTLGVDFARLTIFRAVGENWFPNPYPAYRKVD